MSNGRGNTLIAFLLGGIIGAGIALLYAPESGQETRRRIKEGCDDAGEWAKDKVNDARDRVEGGATKIKDVLTDRKEDIRSAIIAGKDAYQRGKEKFLKENV